MSAESDYQAARLTVRLSAIAANFRTVQRLAAPAAVAGVVKADAYGLGVAQVAPALAAAGCDTFFVARLQEGIALRRMVPSARIFVLDGAPPDAVPALLSHRLIPVLNSLAEIAAWSSVATRGSLDAVLHVDTGINRLGLSAEELMVLAGESATRLKGLNLVLVMSHLACSDDPAHAMNARQLSRFQTALAMLPPAPASLAASGGVLLGSDYHFDMVRPGIGLYGGSPCGGDDRPFRTAALLNARILQVRRIDSGESVGYGATFRAKRPTMLATVAVGYADGILRAASARGMAAIGGVRVPYAGRVSMDVLALDITDLPAPPRVGDPVELLGDNVSLGDVAQASGTSEYEILTSLSRRAAREYLDRAA